MTVPRRLPRTQGQRIKNVDRAHASLSGQGMTASARPVVQTRPNPQIYVPPVTAGSGSGDVSTGESGPLAVSIASTTTGSGASRASQPGSVAIGDGAIADAEDGIAISGGQVQSTAPGGIAIGIGAIAEGAHSIAIGASTALHTVAYNTNSVAIGVGAATNADNQVVIGGDGQHVVIAALCLIDSAGNLHRLVVSTGGALSTVPFP